MTGWASSLLALAEAGSSRRDHALEFLIYFLLVCAVIAVASTAIRMRAPRQIAVEAWRFFVTVVVGILIFSAVVFVLEWLFIRPPV